MKPSKDTLRKFGRGLLFAAGAGALTFVADNQAALNIPAEFSPVLVAVIALGFRWLRDARGGSNGDE